ncbi:MAG: RAD55 family ATPase [Candidatus Micrarchaeia archaeon]
MDLNKIKAEVEKIKIPESTNILLISKPGIEKFVFGINFMEKEIKSGRKGIYITTDMSPAEIEEKSKLYGINFKDYYNTSLFFVDCYSWTLGTEIKTERKDIYVPGPSALNDLSIGISQAANICIEKPIVVFQSVSTLLLYNDPEVVFRFLQITGARLKANKSTTIFFCEENMHEEKVVNTLKHLMDGFIEIKEEEIKLNL